MQNSCSFFVLFELGKVIVNAFLFYWQGCGVGSAGGQAGGLCAKRKNSLVSPIYSLNAAGHLQNLHNLLPIQSDVNDKEYIDLICPCC